MPARLRFNTVDERIVHMADSTAMVGEQEIKAIAEVLGQNIIVHIDGSTHESKYGPEIPSRISEPAFRVKYIAHGEAGQYEALVCRSAPPPISIISPLPTLNLSGNNRKRPSSIILTGSQYKTQLENRKTTKSGSRKTETV